MGKVFKVGILLMHLFRLWDPTSLRGSRWPSGRSSNSVGINIGWVRLLPFQWPKFGLTAAKWLIKKIWTNFAFYLSVFIAAFDKQANICCSISSVSRPISSCNHNATDQAIAMDRYQSHFRRVNIFSGKQKRCSKEWPKNLFSSYLRFLHEGKNF